MDERKGPINVAWDRSLEFNAQDVKQAMNDNGWGSLVTASTSNYIQVYTGTGTEARVEDRHVKRQEGATNQFHARLWNIPWLADDDYRVIGSAHYDPWRHGYWNNDPHWSFDTSRREILETWRNIGKSTALQDISNGSGYTADDEADGRIGLVY